MTKILIVGNLNNYAGKATRVALSLGAKVMHAEDANQAMELLRDGNAIEVIMCDIEADIIFLLKSMSKEHINTPLIACGVKPDSKRAVQAINAGALEYLPMPPNEELIGAVLSAVSQEEKHKMIFQDPRMGEVADLAKRIAPSDANILITGESGTGKEVLSRFIHANSKRINKSFVAVNCAAIPENLLESELFGHEKGAFTGAVARRIGKFEEAHEGTLLLDEISEMDVRLQAKLLRAIQEQEFDRVGGSQPVKVNVRILATSNRNLEEEIAKGTFRQDLYFRLNVLNIEIPPLRDRPLDIEVLCEYFIKRFSDDNGLSAKPLSKKALKALKNYPWVGNIRELENTMHRAVLLGGGKEITESAIMLPKTKEQKEQEQKEKELSNNASNDNIDEIPIGLSMADMERSHILNTLNHTLGDRTQTAKILGISIRTLRNRLNQYTDDGLNVPEE